jgi:hypothetical protein
MTKSAKSLYYFGFYVLLTGIIICIIPDKFMSLLKLPEIPAAWARVIGLLVVIIGSYDILNGRNNVKPLIKASIYLRILFFIGILVLFISGQMTKEILPLGIIDLLGAIWTAISLKSESGIGGQTQL